MVVEIYNWFVAMISDPFTAYLLIVALMAVESSFIPFPSEIVVPPAAYFAVAQAYKHLRGCGIGNDGRAHRRVGQLLSGGVARKANRLPVRKQPFRPHLLIDEAKVANAEAYFDKHGAVSTFVGRLIPAVRQLISIPAGLAGMNIGKFVVFTALGAGGVERGACSSRSMALYVCCACRPAGAD